MIPTLARTLTAVFAALAASGCLGTESTNPPLVPIDGDRADGGALVQDGGGTVGSCMCVATSQCEALSEWFAESLREPAPPFPMRRAGSTCIARDRMAPPPASWLSAPTGCLCHYIWGTDSIAHWENDMLLGLRAECDRMSRSTTECLIPARDFTGCDPSDPTSCEAMCDRADALVRADRDRTFDVQPRTAQCEEPSCLCRGVVRIEGRCYAGRPYPMDGARSYDCTLTDGEILALEFPEAEPPPVCAATACDAGAGS